MRKLTNYEGGLGLFDPWFEPFFGEDASKEEKNFGMLSMKTDIKEADNGYTMDVELPGFDKKDINLSLDDGYLTITAKVDHSEKTDEKTTTKKDNYIHRERFSGVASRSYYVGGIQEKDIKAGYKDGVLTINFPKEKKEEIAKQHSIAIE